MSSPSYQDKLIFPAPEISYTVETSQGQVLYLPRDALQRADRRRALGYPSNKLLYSMVQKQKLEEVERLEKLKQEKKEAKMKLRQADGGQKSPFELLAEASDDSGDFDLEEYIESHNNRVAKGEIAKGDSTKSEEDPEKQSEADPSRDELEQKIEMAGRIKEPENLQDRRYKRSRRKQTQQLAHVEQILSQVRKLDKISYIERALEFEPQLFKLQQEREEKQRKLLYSRKVIKTEQMKAIQKQILLGNKMQFSKADAQKESAREDNTQISSKGPGSGQVENPGDTTSQSDVVGEETQRQIESSSQSQKEAFSAMDVEETDEQKEMREDNNSVATPVLQDDDPDQPTALLESQLEDDFSMLNNESSCAGLPKNSVPPPQETKSMKFIESTQVEKKQQGAKKWRRGSKQKVPQAPSTPDLHSELSRSKSIQVKEDQSKRRMMDHIPILYLPYDEAATKIIIYFHGNAEDIGLAFDLLYLMGQRLQAHVVAVEYPGYGLYKTSHANEQQIKEDAVTVYDYLTKCMGIDQQDIILFGRSMGSGPTSYLASVREPHALILMSPYTSIKNAAKSILGWASFLGFIIVEKFRNIDAIKNAQCPVMLIHGKQDNLIPCSHSEELYEACSSEVPALLHMPLKMDHNEFNLEIDLVDPIKEFLLRLKQASKPPKQGPKQDDTDNDEEGSEHDSSDLDSSESSSGDDVIKRRSKKDKPKKKKRAPKSRKPLKPTPSKKELGLSGKFGAQSYVDEVEKNQIQARQAEQLEKNFDAVLKRQRRGALPVDRIQSLSERLQPTKAKSEHRLLKKQEERKANELDDAVGKAGVVRSISEKEQDRYHHHFEIKTSNYNMTTHCSRVDESFADYLFEAVRGEGSNSSGDDLNYENIIESLLSPKDKKKKSHRPSRPGSGPMEPKVVDENADGQAQMPGVSKQKGERLKQTNLVLYFDQSLFEAPPVVRKLEEDLQKEGSGESAYSK